MLSPEAIVRAAAVLERGEAVILPTDTVPGLFILDTPSGETRIAEIKGRSISKRLARMFGSRKQIEKVVKINRNTQGLAIERLLPGRITLILPSARKGEDTIGVRLPMDSSLRTLIRRTGPLIATSANLSGQQLRDPSTLPRELLKKVALVEEDKAYSRFITPAASTVLDLTGGKPVILRKGSCSLWIIGRRLSSVPYLADSRGLNVGMVCGGNTCRSPMAEVLLREFCQQLPVNIISAGISASRGLPAARFAAMIMSEQGLSLASHRSRTLNAEFMSWADLVLVMTRHHLLTLRRTFPLFADRTFLLSGFPQPWPHGKNIDDPIGGSLEVYRNTSRQITGYLKSVYLHLKEVLTDGG